MLKQLAKTTIYTVFYIIRSLLKPILGFKEVVVLMYHSVDKNGWSLSVDPEVFERQMRFLNQNYQVVSLDKIIRYAKGEISLPSKSVAITFDDGYLDNYLNAWPILKKYNLPATIFLITNENRTRGPGCTFPLFYWKEAKEMINSGLISIETHTDSHPDDLKSLAPDQIKKEIIIAKQKIKNNLGVDSRIFAFPGGKYNQKIIDCLKEEGYIASFTTDEGLIKLGDDLFRLKRISAHRSVSFFAFKVRLTKAIDWYAKLKKILIK